MNKKSRSSLFLMEMIISILLFSVTCAVCTQLFVQTHLKQKESKDLQFAAISSQNIAELTQDCPGIDADSYQEWIKNLYPSIQKQDDHLVLYFDQDYQECTEKELAAYELQICYHIREDIRITEIQMLRKEDQMVLYDLTRKKYIAGAATDKKEDV